MSPSPGRSSCPGVGSLSLNRRATFSEYGWGETASPNTSSSGSGLPPGVSKRSRCSIRVMWSHTVVSAKRRPGQRRWPVPKGMKAFPVRAGDGEPSAWGRNRSGTYSWGESHRFASWWME